MVKPRKLTGTEWHDLARGCRLMAARDAEDYEKNKGGGYDPGRYLEYKRIHEEMAELCDYWGTQADLAALEASKAAAKKSRDSAPPGRGTLDGSRKKAGKNNVVRLRRGPS